MENSGKCKKYWEFMTNTDYQKQWEIYIFIYIYIIQQILLNTNKLSKVLENQKKHWEIFTK